MYVGMFAGSGDSELMLGTHAFKAKDGTEAVFKVTRGDYAALMKHLADNLDKAKVRKP